MTEPRAVEPAVEALLLSEPAALPPPWERPWPRFASLAELDAAGGELSKICASNQAAFARGEMTLPRDAAGMRKLIQYYQSESERLHPPPLPTVYEVLGARSASTCTRAAHIRATLGSAVHAHSMAHTHAPLPGMHYMAYA